MKPTSEKLRQAKLDALKLDSFAGTAVDDLTRLAAETFGVPISAISIVDGDRQWFKSKLGIDIDETPRSTAFCDYAIRTPDTFFVIEDATQDVRFASNPLVTGAPGLRFYAAAPLTLSSGYAIGGALRDGYAASQSRFSQARAAAVHGRPGRLHAGDARSGPIVALLI